MLIVLKVASRARRACVCRAEGPASHYIVLLVGWAYVFPSKVTRNSCAIMAQTSFHQWSRYVSIVIYFSLNICWFLSTDVVLGQTCTRISNIFDPFRIPVYYHVLSKSHFRVITPWSQGLGKLLRSVLQWRRTKSGLQGLRPCKPWRFAPGKPLLVR